MEHSTHTCGRAYRRTGRGPRRIISTRPRASGAGCPRSITSASASCTWCGVLSAFLMGGMFALLVRLSLLTPQHMLFGKVLVTAETYNRFFTLHGAIMVFLFIIPSIPASLGELRAAADAGRQGRRVSAAQPGQLLPLVHRRDAWRSAP